MTYKVVLIHSAEGYSVSCPSLPGCASHGETEEQALENIRSAIHDYVEVQQEMEVNRIERYVDVDMKLYKSKPAPFRVTPRSFELPKEWTDNKTSTLIDLLEGPEWRYNSLT